MKHLWWLAIPVLCVLAVGAAIWQASNPEPDPIVKLMDQKRACEAQAQTAFKMEWCEAQFKDAVLEWHRKGWR
jgi:hypothetical protein